MIRIKSIPSMWCLLPEELTKLKESYRLYTIHGHQQAIDIKEQRVEVLDMKLQEVDVLGMKVPETFTIEGDTAIMDISGVITPTANLFSMLFGGSTLDVMSRDFKALIEEEDVKSIVLSINSPGGAAFGIQEFANLVFNARETKSIFTISSTIMASAALWIGAAANEVFITSETVMTGSIGARIDHIDTSQLEEKLGIKTTTVAAGKFKNIPASDGPLTEEGKAVLQEQVDHFENAFVEDVAKFRGTSADNLRANGGDGRVFLGSKGIGAGLVDGFKSLDDLINNINATGGKTLVSFEETFYQ